MFKSLNGNCKLFLLISFLSVFSESKSQLQPCTYNNTTVCPGITYRFNYSVALSTSGSPTSTNLVGSPSGSMPVTTQITNIGNGSYGSFGSIVTGANDPVAGGFSGGEDDYAIFFDPNNATSSSTVTVMLDLPCSFTNVRFRINDIDCSTPSWPTLTNNNRRDRVTILAYNKGVLVPTPSITAVAGASATFTIAGNVMLAKGQTTGSDNDNLGSAQIDFGSTYIDSIRIFYDEEICSLIPSSSTPAKPCSDFDPANRGIAVFAGFEIFVPCTISLSGNVFNDLNGLLGDNTVNGTGLGNPSSTQLYANLLDGSGNVVNTVPVSAGGAYTFNGVSRSTSYTVQLSTNQGTLFSPAPANALPAGWVNTGEFLGTGIGNDGTVNGRLPVTTGTTNITNANFGINSIPESAINVQSTIGNPGGFNSSLVPTAAFQTSTGANPNTNDANGGAVTQIRITAFPSNTNSITINGTVYTNGGACPPATVCTAWPGGGVTVSYTNGVGPSVPISVDPIEGNVDVVIPFAARDAAGAEDATPGSVTIPFRTIPLSGLVWNDADGSLTQNGGEQVINGTNSGGGLLTGAVLYANLIDPSGNVIATVPVQSNGTYNFPNVPQTTTNLVVQISSNQGVVGSLKPATSVPAGWGIVGENKNGQGGPGDATPNGEIIINAGAVTITQQNFAIERLPDSDPKSYIIAKPTLNSFLTLNGAGLTPGPLSGSDPEDGTLGNSNRIAITSLPTNNNQIWYSGVQITLGADGINPPSPSNPFIINSYNPALLQIRFTGNGSTGTSFTYAFRDAAGLQDPTPATYSLSWTGTLPVNLISFNAARSGNNSIINWNVESQIDLKEYYVESSNNGREPFTRIAVIAANNQNAGSYYYSDINASGRSATVYYRLKMIDNNGTEKISKIVLVRFEKGISVDVRPTIINAGEPVSISVATTDQNIFTVKLINMNGQVMQTKSLNSGSSIQIETTNLSKGIYIIRISGIQSESTERIIVQ